MMVTMPEAKRKRSLLLGKKACGLQEKALGKVDSKSLPILTMSKSRIKSEILKETGVMPVSFII
jgi:hypothetical protein